MLIYGRKKQCEVRDEVFPLGAPNLVLDVFDSEDNQDFLRRRERFCKFGVHEYLVAFDDQPPGLLWHRLDAGCYGLIEPDEDGIIKSHALPNLWLPQKALQHRDWWAVLGCIERGASRRANLASSVLAQMPIVDLRRSRRCTSPGPTFPTISCAPEHDDKTPCGL